MTDARTLVPTFSAPILALTICLTLLASPTTAACAQRIVGSESRGVLEDLLREEQVDLSGTYPTGGSFPDGSKYTATTTLTLQRRVRTPTGTIINIYDVWAEGDTWRTRGIAVQGGKNLFMVAGKGEFGLMLLAPFQLTDAEQAWEARRSAQQEEARRWNETHKNKKYVSLGRGNEPWFTRILGSCDYGYWFYTDSTWGKVQHNRRWTACFEGWNYDTDTTVTGFHELNASGNESCGFCATRRARFVDSDEAFSVVFFSNDGSINSDKAFGLKWGTLGMVVGIFNGEDGTEIDVLSYSDGKFQGTWTRVPKVGRFDMWLKIPPQVMARSPTLFPPQ